MPDTPPTPRLANSTEIAQTLAFALRFDRGRRTRDAEVMAARILAERLVEHLKVSGFVMMRKPPAPDPDASPRLPAWCMDPPVAAGTGPA